MRQERIAFSTGSIMRFPFHVPTDHVDRHVTRAEGVKLSLAIAASSCFRPAFTRIRLTHDNLGLNYSDFKDSLEVNDGGVSGNLGAEVLLSLRGDNQVPPQIVLISDAERALRKKPRNFAKADINAQGAALSSSARERLRELLGTTCFQVRLSERVEGPDALSFLAQTALAGFRTDLDAPSWQEIHGLLIHGLSVARHILDGPMASPAPTARDTISKILVAAGAPAGLAVPTEADLKHCHWMPFGRLVVHLLLIFVSVVGAIGGIVLVAFLIQKFGSGS